ncbi:MAG: leucine-rich repeat domain-containing protein [Clostridia bacterium]|nr:leucine-rich repeat domain-containing protein [Clostridia bacterium]
MKKIICVLLTFLMVLSLFSALSVVTFADTTLSLDGAKYSLNTEKKTAVLTSGASVVGNFTVPDTVEKDGEKYTVTTIQEYAFDRNTNLSFIDIGKVTKIGSYAFRSCSQLLSVNLRGITSIDNYAFQSAGIIYLEFPNTLKNMGMYVMTNCKQLVYVGFEEGAEIAGLDDRDLWTCSAVNTINVAQSEIEKYKGIFTSYEGSVIHTETLPDSIIKDFTGKAKSYDKNVRTDKGRVLAMLTLLNNNNYDISSLGIDLSEYGINPKKDEQPAEEKEETTEENDKTASFFSGNNIWMIISFAFIILTVLFAALYIAQKKKQTKNN